MAVLSNLNVPAVVGVTGWIIAIPVVWLRRSIMITKWKIWAYTNADDVVELKKKAIEQKILYPNDHILTRTEIRTRSRAEQLARLELKYQRSHC